VPSSTLEFMPRRILPPRRALAAVAALAMGMTLVACRASPSGAPTTGATPATEPAPVGATEGAECERIAIDVPDRFVQDATQCMPAAAAMAASALGVAQTPRDIARTIRMHPDGAHFFDIENALRDAGLGAATTVASLEHVAVAVDRGLVPILAIRRGAERHVVIVTAFEQCPEDDAVTVTWIDPLDGLDHRAPSLDLQARRSADQVLFVAPPGTAVFDDWPLPGAAELRSTHARFRAETLYRRAMEHDGATDSALRLVLRANAEDPCWMPPHDWTYRHRPGDVADLAPCPGY